MTAIEVLKYMLDKAESEVPESDRIIGLNVPVDIVREIIDAQPERKTGRWIPCSERLPIARRSVIISTKGWTGEGCYWETTEHHVIWKGYRWNATYWDDEVTAWMPLPEPYIEDGETE